MHSSGNEMPSGRQESERVCGLFVSFSLSLSHQMPSLSFHSHRKINKRAHKHSNHLPTNPYPPPSLFTAPSIPSHPIPFTSQSPSPSPIPAISKPTAEHFIVPFPIFPLPQQSVWNFKWIYCVPFMDMFACFGVV